MKAMKLLSIQVALPQEVHWQRRTVSTGIFKEPVQGPVMLRTLNLDGDRQADLSVHGGTHKAVYVYPGEHYGPWRGRPLSPSARVRGRERIADLQIKGSRSPPADI